MPVYEHVTIYFLGNQTNSKSAHEQHSVILKEITNK